VYGALARVWRPGTRLVFTEHGRLSDSGPSVKRRLANRILGRMPHAVFTVSADLREHLVEEAFSRESVGVIYNGIEPGPLPSSDARTSIRTRLGVSEDTLVVGTIARLDPVKSLETLIRAASELAQERSIALIIVGDGPERAPLERAAIEGGASKHVRFLGHRNDAREWLAGFDVYVNSSISEGVSLTILEAMAAGVPVIATRVGGTPEVVESVGRLVPARSSGAIVSALKELAANAGLRDELGRAARRRVEELFTIDRMVRDYRDVYCRVA
jgi:glycosyltransferase involved in cell wall biosynthesis